MGNTNYSMDLLDDGYTINSLVRFNKEDYIIL